MASLVGRDRRYHAFSMSKTDQLTCMHLAAIDSALRKVNPHARGCGECLALGDSWVHLRQCMNCGHVGCCDDSQNQHATKHYRKTKHPVMRSIEPGESWGWCFVDQLGFDPL